MKAPSPFLVLALINSILALPSSNPESIPSRRRDDVVRRQYQDWNNQVSPPKDRDWDRLGGTKGRSPGDSIDLSPTSTFPAREASSLRGGRLPPPNAPWSTPIEWGVPPPNAPWTSNIAGPRPDLSAPWNQGADFHNQERPNSDAPWNQEQDISEKKRPQPKSTGSRIPKPAPTSPPDLSWTSIDVHQSQPSEFPENPRPMPLKSGPSQAPVYSWSSGDALAGPPSPLPPYPRPPSDVTLTQALKSTPLADADWIWSSVVAPPRGSPSSTIGSESRPGDTLQSQASSPTPSTAPDWVWLDSREPSTGSQNDQEGMFPPSPALVPGTNDHRSKPQMDSSQGNSGLGSIAMSVFEHCREPWLHPAGRPTGFNSPIRCCLQRRAGILAGSRAHYHHGHVVQARCSHQYTCGQQPSCKHRSDEHARQDGA
jgi:hypothetical protein